MLEWLTSYLSERKFNVKVRSSSSSDCLLEIGVPQGSILGPLLFVLYTKDWENIVTKYGFSINLYADDTQIYFAFDVHSENPDLSAVKRCFLEITQWMTKNFLKLNEGKTEFIDIGHYVSPVVSLDLGEVSIIKPVEHAKNLGFMFDHRMNMSEQINMVSKTSFLNLRNLKRIGSRLAHELKVQLVHSNILSFLDYCNSVYGGLTEKNLFKLQKIQNNAVRYIFGLYGKKFREPIMPYLKRLHFLPVKYRIKFKVALLVFKCLNGFAPEYMHELISAREIKRRISRLDKDFFMLATQELPKSTRTDAAFSFYGPCIWNELPYRLRCMTDIELFKKSMKTYYFNIAFEGIS